MTDVLPWAAALGAPQKNQLRMDLFLGSAEGPAQAAPVLGVTAKQRRPRRTAGGSSLALIASVSVCTAKLAGHAWGGGAPRRIRGLAPG